MAVYLAMEVRLKIIRTMKVSLYIVDKEHGPFEWPCVPRKGETVEFDGIQYVITDVAHIFSRTPGSNEAEVVLDLELDD